MRPRPVGEGIGTKTGMDHRQRGFDGRVEKLRIKRSDLARIEHAFVDDRLVGQAWHIKHAALGERRCLDGIFDALTDHVQLALEGELSCLRFARASFFRMRNASRRTADENLADDRLDRPGRGAERGVIGRHCAPTEQRASFLTDDLREQLLAVSLVVQIGRQEYHPYAISAVGRQADVELVALVGEKAVRSLEQDAGPVAGILLAPAGAPMFEVEEDLDRLLDEVVRFAALQIDNETDAAGIMLVLRIVQSLLGWRGGLVHVKRPFSQRGRSHYGHGKKYDLADGMKVRGKRRLARPRWTSWQRPDVGAAR